MWGNSAPTGAESQSGGIVFEQNELSNSAHTLPHRRGPCIFLAPNPLDLCSGKIHRSNSAFTIHTAYKPEHTPLRALTHVRPMIGVLLALAAAAHGSSLVKADGGWKTGRATFYGEPCSVADTFLHRSSSWRNSRRCVPFIRTWLLNPWLKQTAITCCLSVLCRGAEHTQTTPQFTPHRRRWRNNYQPGQLHVRRDRPKQGHGAQHCCPV
jgi:hypothetical protein